MNHFFLAMHRECTGELDLIVFWTPYDDYACLQNQF